jgi:small subunit ribosomal protein S13
MVRISGVNLPRNKRVDIGLTYVFGIGNSSATEILQAADVSPNIRCGDLSDEEVRRLRTIVGENYQVEGDLKRVISQNIKRLIEIGSAAGRRHRVGLPVRGQRTRTNARSRKSKRERPKPVAKKK